ncbi:uncharacterized protein YeaO (DUF488 family) [Haloactinopolyspora alba]|uniref:Uncharacterized protein YeaO (DUF488 family) n=1 Tax=Haloactinopolyspora alba TaxID=648780 RepID=A0A2P8EFI4_9ACTN|nr:DUF488 family protein [Haloactinopolyspora alba]PSL08194.1 uncharacterized protein YeaO (DUF488 family) [Haloactinopolyspora alba]
MLSVQVRRVYDEPQSDDGLRVLVDGVWPRGIAKQRLAHDEWLRDLAPSSDLRRWFGHDRSKFAEFRRRYRTELDTATARQTLDRLRATTTTVTLLTATKDVQHSHAAVLAELLENGQPDEGGDPACWLAGVCPECGRFVPDEPPTTCPGCGTRITQD